MKLAAFALLGLMATFSLSPALAHAELIGANPAAGAELKAAPSEIRLEFGEALEASFCRVQVKDEEGTSVAVGELQVQGAMMVLTLKPLEPGGYSVIWRAISIDGHVTEGNYRFTVATPPE